MGFPSLFEKTRYYTLNCTILSRNNCNAYFLSNVSGDPRKQQELTRRHQQLANSCHRLTGSKQRALAGTRKSPAGVSDLLIPEGILNLLLGANLVNVPVFPVGLPAVDHRLQLR
jgi:hypothetical protein